jgi:hypothetical protein
MLEVVAFGVVLAVILIIGVFALRKSESVREKMLEDFQTNEYGELDVFESEANLSHPTIPFPSPHELGINKDSQLERVYKHLITNIYLSPKDHKFLGVKRSAGYVYRLRKMGFTISTEKDDTGKFIRYKLICYKLK